MPGYNAVHQCASTYSRRQGLRNTFFRYVSSGKANGNKKINKRNYNKLKNCPQQRKLVIKHKGCLVNGRRYLKTRHSIRGLYGPAIPLLGKHTEETRRERDTCTPMFIAALFIIARTWKQPRCPSADEWIRKLWYIYTVEYYSAINKNTFESVLMSWMKLEPIIHSEVSQKEKHQYSIITHIYGI